jgi:monolysocardiolipin acyltransferase
MTQAIRLLSGRPHDHNPAPAPSAAPTPDDIPADPFTTGSLTYTTTGRDAFPAPASYPARNRHAWLHVFPEGCVHQHAAVDARYFKWGVARLIHEAEPAPDVVPVFIDGTQHVMHEERTFQRFLPRAGRRIRVAFGDTLDVERAFGDLRVRWRVLVARTTRAGGAAPTAVGSVGGVVGGGEDAVGELADDELKYGVEARAIRTEVARRMRDEVLKVRASLGGYPEPEPAFALAETWALEAKDPSKKKYKSRVDGSQINQD